MYVEKLHLQNIKCFEETEFSFLKEDEKPAKWVTILGENATGKTTSLQSLGLLLSGLTETKNLVSDPSSWIRNENRPGRLSFTYSPNKNDFRPVFGGLKSILEFNYKTPEHKSNSGFIVIGHIPIELKFNESFFDPETEEEHLFVEPKIFNNPGFYEPDIDSGFSISDFTFVKGFFVSGYGPFRRLYHGDLLPQIEIPKNERHKNFTSLFSEEKPLVAFNQWVSSLDYRSAKGDGSAEKSLAIGIEALDDLFPEGVIFDKESLSATGRVNFLVQGKSIPTLALSDGYRSVLALGGDLIWRLINAFPDSEDPMKEEGVVLIDELDTHLHPRWQAWIAQKLRSAFPNIQFIVTTHSPLVAMGAYWNGETGELRDDVLTLKLEINDGKASVQRIDDDLAAMDINRALESPAFGMVAPRPPEVEKKIDRYDELLEKGERTEGEQTEFQQLQQFMAEARPIGGKPAPGSLEAKLESYLRRNLP